MADASISTFPMHLYYDVENQIWYEPLDSGDVKVGFTPLAIELAGEVLVFTPKRIGKDFEAQRSFAVIECGKWVGAARAAFNGVVVTSNEQLTASPSLLNTDAFGDGWMLVVRPESSDWRKGLITGTAIQSAFFAWMNSESYKSR